jgi:cell wall-associated NlpC family hydrolase
MGRLRSVALAAGLIAVLPGSARPQGPAFHIGRIFNDGGWTTFGISWAQRPLGPLSLALGGTMLRGDGASTARLWGADAEASLFRGGRPGAYAVGGISGGFGTGGAEAWWRSWSAGLGYELIPLPFLSLGIEGRYRGFGERARSGFELAFRVGANLGGSPTHPPTPGAELLPIAATAAPAAGTSLTRSDAQRLLEGVIATADSAIGTRYRYGGTGEDGRGFDCSGLIQYAYARHGITLPRTSTEQATEGREVTRSLAALQPGDLLTFSSSGRGVTHVGLYVGNGRFIHSASAGVQTSTLSADDPYGKWWYARWVGVRRIVEGAA